jgi:hypothetical protein
MNGQPIESSRRDRRCKESRGSGCDENFYTVAAGFERNQTPRTYENIMKLVNYARAELALARSYQRGGRNFR